MGNSRGKRNQIFANELRQLNPNVQRGKKEQKFKIEAKLIQNNTGSYTNTPWWCSLTKRVGTEDAAMFVRFSNSLGLM